jgi:hypothetical protein
MLLAAKAISYPDGAGGLGGAAGVSFDETLMKLGIFEDIKPKIKRMKGVSLMHLLTNGDSDIRQRSERSCGGSSGASAEGDFDPNLLVGFTSAHSNSPETAKALLGYISSTDAGVAYKACGMQPGK